MVFTFCDSVRFTAIRARVSVITCYAHSEKVELQYWLLLMLPHVGLVCIKSDKSDPFVSTLADPLVHLAKWLTLNEEKRASNHYYPKSTWLDAQWWLVEHSDWTWAKATNLDWTLVPDPLEENERSSSRRWITWTYGLLDLVDGHVTIISNRTIRTRPDPYTHRLLGRWFLLSERSVWFGISDHFNLFSFKLNPNWKSVIFQFNSYTVFFHIHYMDRQKCPWNGVAVK